MQRILYLLQNNTKQKVFGFQNTRFILPWINLLELDKFAKTQILGWKIGWKVNLKVTGAQPGFFHGRTGFLDSFTWLVAAILVLLSIAETDLECGHTKANLITYFHLNSSKFNNNFKDNFTQEKVKSI